MLEEAAQRIVLRLKELVEDVEPAVTARLEEVVPQLLCGHPLTLGRRRGVGAGAESVDLSLSQRVGVPHGPNLIGSFSRVRSSMRIEEAGGRLAAETMWIT
jgi:hypothetical protein